MSLNTSPKTGASPGPTNPSPASATGHRPMRLEKPIRFLGDSCDKKKREDRERLLVFVVEVAQGFFVSKVSTVDFGGGCTAGGVCFW